MPQDCKAGEEGKKEMSGGPHLALNKPRASKAVRRHGARTEILRNGKERVYSKQNLNYIPKTNIQEKETVGRGKHLARDIPNRNTGNSSPP